MSGRVILYDNTDKLTPFWRAGSLISGTPRDLPATSWEHAYDLLAEEQARSPIRELQVWGHGYAGRPMIAGRSVSLRRLAAACPTLDLVWWRSCDVHRAARGRAFAEAASRILEAVVVGHTVVISKPWPLHHRRICALRPGERVWWDDDTNLGLARTIAMRVPAIAYREVYRASRRARKDG